MDCKRHSQSQSQGPTRKIMKLVHLTPEVEQLLRCKDFTQERVQVRHEGIQVFVTIRSLHDHEEFKPPLQPGEIRLPEHLGDNRPPQRHVDNMQNQHPIANMPQRVADNRHQYHGEIMPDQRPIEMRPLLPYLANNRPRNEHRPKPIRPAGC